MANNISLEPYKGVRDFYPEDKAVQDYIFDIWKKVAESFGYISYSSSVLEPLELYKSKSSEEIVNDQIYKFIDRGEREVALRPEMTPTVARMIAAKSRELPSPIRWYSIANFFRYERPQRGRYREFWQLNLDMFGEKGIEADAEMVSIAPRVMKAFGAKEEDYILYVNSRELMDDLYGSLGINEDKRQIVSRIIDKKDKIEPEVFRQSLEEVLDESVVSELITLLNSRDGIFEKLSEKESTKKFENFLETLDRRGVKNIVFNPTLVRGFDYYTGIVFEVFDSNKENSRSIFGGGRYDKLVKELSGQDVPAVGFAVGDVTIYDFLETHGLLPKLTPSTNVWIAIAPETNMDEVYKLATELRQNGVKVAVDISGKKLGDQISSAEKRGIPLILTVGQNEISSNNFTVRRMLDRVEKKADREGLVAAIKEL